MAGGSVYEVVFKVRAMVDDAMQKFKQVGASSKQMGQKLGQVGGAAAPMASKMGRGFDTIGNSIQRTGGLMEAIMPERLPGTIDSISKQSKRMGAMLQHSSMQGYTGYTHLAAGMALAGVGFKKMKSGEFHPARMDKGVLTSFKSYSQLADNMSVSMAKAGKGARAGMFMAQKASEVLEPSLGAAYTTAQRIRSSMTGMIPKFISTRMGTISKRVTGSLGRIGLAAGHVTQGVDSLQDRMQQFSRVGMPLAPLAMKPRAPKMRFDPGLGKDVAIEGRKAEGASLAEVMPAREKEVMLKKELSLQEGKLAEGMSQTSRAGQLMRGMAGRLTTGLRRLGDMLGYGAKANMRFKMHMLSVMFFGMAMQRMFYGYIQSVLQMTGVLDMLSATITMFLLPIILPLLPIIFSILEWFMNLPEPIRAAIGMIMILVTALGSFLMVAGMMSLGIAGMMMWISGLIVSLPLILAVGIPLLLFFGALVLGILKNQDAFKVLASLLFEAAKTVLPLFMDALSTLGELLGAVLAGDFDRAGELLDKFIDQLLIALAAIVDEMMPIVMDIIDLLLKGLWDMLPLILIELKEILNKVLDWFESDVKPWLDSEVFPKIAEWIGEGLEQISSIIDEEIKPLLKIIHRRLLPLVEEEIDLFFDKVIEKIKSRLGGISITTILTGLGLLGIGLKVSGLLLPLITILVGLSKILIWLFSTVIGVLGIKGLLVLGLLIGVLWTNGKKILGAFMTLISGVISFVKGLLKFFAVAVGAIGLSVEIVSRYLQYVFAMLRGDSDKMEELASDLGETINSWFSALFESLDDILIGGVAKILEGIGGLVVEILAGAIQLGLDLVDIVWDLVGDLMGIIDDFVFDGKDVMKDLFDFIDGIAAKIGDTLKGINLDGIGDIFSKGGEFVGGLHFAEGGIVPGPRGAPIRATVHGGETIVPAGKSMGGTINISVNVDSPVLNSGLDISDLADEISRSMTRELRRTNIV